MATETKRAAKSARSTHRLDVLLELRQKFLGFLERRIPDRELAEDILQAAYLRALHAENGPVEQDSAVTWFYRILRNAIIDHYRRRSTEQSALDRWAKELETQPQTEPELEEAVCACLALLVDRMPSGYASLLRAVDLDDQPLTEYAKQQGITAGNAAVRAHRARTALRKSLIECCGACADHHCVHCTCKHRPSSMVHAVRL
ncbi:sigma-70 family RNA polymerase sigma factor [Silvibacterium acidisoli]|uniref:sigma-70 family RNA polymerase sigma factor n=1 Tax=Acidobacteriaceae bacterium ZG23-2 TaxID=2883246 RepID=UPI00406C0E6A